MLVPLRKLSWGRPVEHALHAGGHEETVEDVVGKLPINQSAAPARAFARRVGYLPFARGGQVGAELPVAAGEWR